MSNHRNRSDRTLTASLLLALLLVPSALPAEEGFAPFRTRPVLRSTAAPLPLADLELSPAALALVQGVQTGFIWARESQEWLAGLALPGPLRVSLGIAHLSPLTAPDGWRTSMGIALDLHPAVGLGLGWMRTVGEGALAGRDPLSVGMLLRPARTLSISLAAHNITQESFPVETCGERSGLALFDGAVAIRPGTDRLLLGAGLAVDRTGQHWEPRLDLAGTIVPGIELGLFGHLAAGEGDPQWGLGAALRLSTFAFDLAGGYQRQSAGDHDWAGTVRFSSVSEPTVIAPRRRFVTIDLPGLPENRQERLLGRTPESLLDFRRRLARMADDPEVDGILFTIRQAPGGWAQTQELVSSIAHLRQRGKVVVAHLFQGGNRELFLAAAADKVIVNPATVIFATGISASLQFYRELLAMVGLEAQFVRVGDYKSYPEKFILDEPSEANRKDQSAMMTGFFGQLVSGLAQGRSRSEEEIRKAVDSAPFTASQLLAAGLADLSASRSENRDLLKEAGYPDLRLANSYPVRQIRNDRWGAPPRIAVVVVEGTMIDGISFTLPLVGQQFCGSETVCAAIRQAAADNSVQGILVRINSPGGAALSAERMHQALLEAGQKKPVVVSIGNVAASGGYYLAVAANPIFISSGSVTGSIGIWFGKVVISGLLDKLKVGRTPFKQGDHADLLDLDHRLTPEELESSLARIVEIYNLFVSRVAAGRKLSTDEVDALGQGRVWLGSQALEHRLADAQGGALEALQELCRRCGVAEEEVELQYYPRATMAQMLSASLTGGGLNAELESLGEALTAISRTHLWALELAPPPTP